MVQVDVFGIREEAPVGTCNCGLSISLRMI